MYLNEAANEFDTEYYKYKIVSYYECDAEEIANYFIEDLEQYQDKIESSQISGMIDYTVKTDTGSYYWDEHFEPSGCCFLKRDGGLTKTAYEKQKEQALAYVESLDVDLRCEVVEDKEREVHYEYRQYINGTQISDNDVYGTVIYVDVSKYDGFYVMLSCLIEEVEILETYETKDFISVEAALKRAESYRKKSASDRGEDPSEIEVCLKEVEVVYYTKEVNGENVLIPMYEMQVEEKVYGRSWDAVYTIDALSGIVSQREGAF